MSSRNVIFASGKAEVSRFYRRNRSRHVAYVGRSFWSSSQRSVEARRSAHQQSIARLQQAAITAVSTLLKVMVGPATPASTKVRAADSVLEHSAKGIELEDIEARLAELERASEANKQGR
jgi:hypothetical protein